MTEMLQVTVKCFAFQGKKNTHAVAPVYREPGVTV